MECDSFRPLLVEKHEGTISAENAELLDRHLATCDRCREDSDLIGTSFTALREVQDVEAPTHYFANLLPRIRQRIDEHARGPSGFPIPAWFQRLLAPGSAVAVLGSMVALYVILTPKFDPAHSGLREIVADVPRDDIDRLTEAVSYSEPLSRTLDPSQRMLEAVSNPAAVSVHFERELVDDQLAHGHSFTIFLAGESPFEDIADEDVDSIILKLDKTQL